MLGLFKKEKIDGIVLEKIEKQTAPPEAKIPIEKYKELVRLQRERGLGNPDTKRFEDFFQMQIEYQQSIKLRNSFSPVKAPNFWHEGKNRGRIGMFEPLPMIVMKKAPGMNSANYSKDSVVVVLKKLFRVMETFEQYIAPVPIMPLSVQELGVRARTMAPSANFYLIFMPAWENKGIVEQKDPVLVAELPTLQHWFEIGHWDGDADLIRELLEGGN